MGSFLLIHNLSVCMCVYIFAFSSQMPGPIVLKFLRVANRTTGPVWENVVRARVEGH